MQSRTLKEIREHIPDSLFVRNTARSLRYLARDLLLATVLAFYGSKIDPVFLALREQQTLPMPIIVACKWICWMAYWWFQGLVFTGLWVVGHECGHMAFSPNKVVCDIVGFTIHTLLWTPYFSWKIVHHRHHSHHASMEHDEVYIPKTRSDLGIPPDATGSDLGEYIQDTPIYTLFMLIRQQILAFPAYLLFNVSGQKNYPKYSNHFNPNAIMFTPTQRNAVLMSNVGILGMMAACYYAKTLFGVMPVLKLYGIPWLLVTHWFIMITYLHHTDLSLPHYRNTLWNYQRGAASTCDRDFLGWQGRFFLHDVAHYHVIHHFFPKMPFYHGESATRYLKELLGPHYHRSTDPVFLVLWKNYNSCQFVDDEGDVLFYRDRQGSARFEYTPRNT
ncbi:fatty acid desaturase-domain-containing protein [Mycena pura]|uniref:Fatty acid desaturase-domain-containing protein n=1 Tax=Mycena pura TaxID=153505 RepID=A0AAD7E2F9_9AGAR|nr:fatty acid desaturase-domain-containing protein [Mycena pura]